jgi:hypothetical protein
MLSKSRVLTVEILMYQQFLNMALIQKSKNGGGTTSPNNKDENSGMGSTKDVSLQELQDNMA